MGLKTILFAASVMASTAFADGSIHIVNNCVKPLYLVASDAQTRTGTVELTKGLAFDFTTSGTGESIGFSTDPAFYSKATAKLILGYSVTASQHLIYYSLAADYGNPFAGESVAITSTTPGCTNVYSPNGVTYACADTAHFTLTIC